MDININTMKDIFGSMPIDHLPAAQVLATKNRNRNLIIIGFVVVGVAGIYIGYKYSENKNKKKFDIEPPKPNGGAEKKANYDAGKFKHSTASNFSARPVGVRSKPKSKFEPNLDSYVDGDEKTNESVD